VYCPSCGAENEEGSRYCASCGWELPKGAPAKRSDSGAPVSSDESEAGPAGFTGVLARIVGTTRKARLVSAGIVATIVIAIAAFIALGSNQESNIPQDGLTKAMDANCVHHKVEIAKAQAQAINGGDLASVSRYADSVVKVAGNWRIQLANLEAPADRAKPIEALRAALLEVQIEAGALSRSAREANRSEVAATSQRVDSATSNVESEIQELELERCSRLVFSTGRLVRQ
jgi:hypothetical protein